MATKLFFYQGYSSSGGHRANARWNFGTGAVSRTTIDGGSANNYCTVSLTDHQNDDGYTQTLSQISTVAGPTVPLEVSPGYPRLEYISAPLSADATVSGTIAVHVWSYENNMSANATIGCVIEQLGPTGSVVAEIGRGLLGTEVSSSAATAYDWNITPTSTGLKKGDRLRARLYIDDATGINMGTGYFVNFYTTGNTAGVSGDSYITLTETLSFAGDTASGTTIYLTNTTSDVATSAVDREAWTSRGAGVQNDVTNTAAGPVSPIQVTDTAGGTVVDWWTRGLEAFTLGGAVLVNLRAIVSNAATNAALKCEIAVTDSDGSNPVAWASALHHAEIIATSEAAYAFLVAGPDTSVASGKRLRIRISVDDARSDYYGGDLASGYTVTTYYAGTSAGASGDSYLTFTNTLVEYTTLTTISPTLLDSARDIYAPTVLPQPVTIGALTLIDSGRAIYEPTVATGQILGVDFLDSGRAIYEPSLTYRQDVTLGLIDSGPTVYAPTVAAVTTTTIYITDTDCDSTYWTPYASNVTGVATKRALTSRGGGVVSVSKTIAGGLANNTFGNLYSLFVLTPPLAQDVTISGDYLFNICMAESDAGVNVETAVGGFLQHADSSSTEYILGNYSASGSELTTSEAAYQWSVTPTSVNAKKGDRILLRIGVKVTGTSGAGTTTLWYNGSSPGASGDSYITFSDLLVFETDDTPAGSALYLTNTASDINPGAEDERKLDLSRGASVQTASWTLAADGPTYAGSETQLQIGGVDAVWYSPALNAVTLTQPIKLHVRALRNSTAHSSVAFILSKRTAAGVETSFARGWLNVDDLTTSETVYELVSGTRDVSIAGGGRIRLALYAVDPATAWSASGSQVQVKYAGTSGGATGDTYLILNETITEYTVDTLTLGLIDSARDLYAPTVEKTTAQTIGASLIDSGRAVYAPVLEGLEGIPGIPYPDPIDARYKGESMAVHVLHSTTADTFSAAPVGPLSDETPLYTGQSQQIFAHPDSPPDWYSPGIVGPEITYTDSPTYRGVSPAIHVFGEDRDTTTWPPIHGCECGDCQFSEGFVTGSPVWEILSGDPATLQLTDTSMVDANLGGSGHVIGITVSEHINPTLFAELKQAGLLFTTAFVMTEPAPEQNSRCTMEMTFGWYGAPPGGVTVGISYTYNPGSLYVNPYFTRTGYVFWWNGSTTEYANVFESQDFVGWGTLEGTLGMSISSNGYTVYCPWGSNTGDGIAHPATTPSTPDSMDTEWSIAFTTNNLSGYNFGWQHIYFETLSFSLPMIYGTEWNPGWCGELAPCTDCEDPYNPGYQIPDFTPGYMPIFRRQIGDPTTSLDGWICTLESAAMVLDWHTRGAVQVWGGELVPYVPGGADGIYGSGASLSDARAAWGHWGQYLDVRSGQHWTDLMACLADGRAVVLQGEYGEFTSAESCQDNFTEGHAISVYPYLAGDRLLVGDPLCDDFRGIRVSSLQAYAEVLGAEVYGVTSPQKILFAVSRPWVP